MTVQLTSHSDQLAELKSATEASLAEHGVAILPPMDVEAALRLVRLIRSDVKVTMLDPWYNKGVGGTRDDYKDYITNILRLAGAVSEHVFLWGFPEIVACFVERVPPSLKLTAWLTWYYKNSPSVIRGWRSSQMACLHLTQPGVKLFPEHFLNEAQKERWVQGKLRYMPGPTSVIEGQLDDEATLGPTNVIQESLLVGFVGKKEQTGHPAQKPVAVFQKLLLMTTKEGDVVFDPMSGSGTTAKAALNLGRLAIISDHSEVYTQLAEQRLGIDRITSSSGAKLCLEELITC